MTFVMISHSGNDTDIASEVAVHLASEHIAVWFDSWKIDIGDSIPGRIEEGLASSTHVVLIWSKAAANSPWVTAERRSAVAAALESGRPRILVVRLDDHPLPALLNDRKYLRWHDGTPDDHRTLAEAILGRLTNGDVIRKVVATYNSLVYDPTASGPLDYYIACPGCGSQNLTKSSATDYAHDRVYYFVRCAECGWGDSTE